MLCTWHRWRISRAFDTDSPLPRSVEHHLRGCLRCREHHNFAVYLKNQGKKDFDLLRSREIRDLANGVPAHWDTVGGERPSRRRRLIWIPTSAAAAVLAAAALIVVLVHPTREGGLSALNPLSEWSAANSTLATALETVDSPYLTEFENLKTSFTAAADFLQDFLDIRIGNGE